MSQLLGEQKKGKVFVVSAPAGTGKTTLVEMLCREFPDIIESVSCTTRPPRAHEVEGKHYHFLSKEAFQKKIEANDFYEYAQVFGHWYGTSKQFVEEALQRGQHVILVIDTQGALALKKILPATFLFISPPSVAELRKRLSKRQSEGEHDIAKRLSWAEKEMACISQYDYHIVNDTLSVAYEVLRSIIIAEGHRVVARKDSL